MADRPQAGRGFGKFLGAHRRAIRRRRCRGISLIRDRRDRPEPDDQSIQDPRVERRAIARLPRPAPNAQVCLIRFPVEDRLAITTITDMGADTVGPCLRQLPGHPVQQCLDRLACHFVTQKQSMQEKSSTISSTSAFNRLRTRAFE